MSKCKTSSTCTQGKVECMISLSQVPVSSKMALKIIHVPLPHRIRLLRDKEKGELD